MTKRQIYITRRDFERLSGMIDRMRSERDADNNPWTGHERRYGLHGEAGLIRNSRELKTSFREAELERMEELESELNRAIVLENDRVPPDLITMNSKVRLKDMDTGKEEFYQLVYPEDADIEQKKISILAPIGTAILGYKAGDIIEWQVPAGLRKLKIGKILYQPE